MTSAIPDHTIPAPVVELADHDPITPVWANEAGGITYRLGDSVAARYLKWQPPHPEIDLAEEARRLEWAARYTPVPRVLDSGATPDAAWMLTAGLPGLSAVVPPWIERPEIAIRAVGRGLRLLHDRLPVDECPWTWSPEERIAEARSRGIQVPAHLSEPPPIDRLVVCHGDACCPNTLLDDRGEPCAHVDLGSLGVADRWADIAVAAGNTLVDFGAGWADILIEGYGVEPDRERLAYYRELWDAT